MVVRMGSMDESAGWLESNELRLPIHLRRRHQVRPLLIAITKLRTLHLIS